MMAPSTEEFRHVLAKLLAAGEELGFVENKWKIRGHPWFVRGARGWLQTLGLTTMSESIVIALKGVTGAVIGSVATIAVQWLSHCLQEQAAAKRDKPRQDLLLEMLKAPQYQWRKLETLMHVIGADEETTKRLLLAVGARASEDGQPLWGLVERNPLPIGQE